jgi:hypothetical protein
MTDPDTKYRHSKRRKRNYIAKKMLSDAQFKKKIHLDEKTKKKQEKWIYDEYYDETEESA